MNVKWGGKKLIYLSLYCSPTGEHDYSFCNGYSASDFEAHIFSYLIILPLFYHEESFT